MMLTACLLDSKYPLESIFGCDDCRTLALYDGNSGGEYRSVGSRVLLEGSDMDAGMVINDKISPVTLCLLFVRSANSFDSPSGEHWFVLHRSLAGSDDLDTDNVVFDEDFLANSSRLYMTHAFASSPFSCLTIRSNLYARLR